MAVLRSKYLSLDFQYSGYTYNWVEYQLFFLWKNEPIVNDNVLKRESEFWKKRFKSAFLGSDDERDDFLPFLKKVLDSNVADYWEPLDPDFIVALYPDDFFPFLPPKIIAYWESDRHKEIRKQREKLKAEKGNLPDDLFTIIIFVDANNFKGADAYYGSGISLNMVVTRHELETFITELEQEYIVFKDKYKIEDDTENTL